MFMKSLCQYYDNLYSNGDIEAPTGFENIKIGAVIVIDNNGNFVDVEIMNNDEGKIGVEFICPLKPVNKTSGTCPSLFYGTVDYVFGLVSYNNVYDVIKNNDSLINSFKKKYENCLFIDEKSIITFISNRCNNKEAIKKIQKLYESAKDKNEQFKNIIIENFSNVDNDGLKSLITFLKNQNNFQFNKTLLSDKTFKRIIKDKNNFSFRLKDVNQLIHEDQDLFEVIWDYKKKELAGNESVKGICSVSGKLDYYQSKHPKVIGNGKLISNNMDYCIVYGNSKIFPIGITSSYKFHYILGKLISSIKKDDNYKQCIKIDDETHLLYYPNNVNNTSELINLIYKSVIKGIPPSIPKNKKSTFSLLELKLITSGRCAVTFFDGNISIEKVYENVKKYFDDFDIGKPVDLRLYTLIKKTDINLLIESASAKKKYELLYKKLYKSIIFGEKYPTELCNNILNFKFLDFKNKRVYDDQILAFAKAILKRNYNMVMSMGLDRENRNTGYLLGRLFAIENSIYNKCYFKKNNKSDDKKTFYFSNISRAVNNRSHILNILFSEKFVYYRRQINVGYYDKDISEIVELLNIKSINSKSLKSDEKLQFLLGYEHQTDYNKEQAKQKTSNSVVDNEVNDND